MNRQESSLASLVPLLCETFSERDIDQELVWQAVQSSLDARALVQNLAEALRVPQTVTSATLRDLGFPHLAPPPSGPQAQTDTGRVTEDLSPFPSLFSVEVRSERGLLGSDELSRQLALISQTDHPLLKHYRDDVTAYLDDFLRGDGERIQSFVQESFGGPPKYLITTGIGANEQFSHFVQYWNHTYRGSKPDWRIVTYPSQLRELPADAGIDNTLFMEFSRSGVTEETVKIHEGTVPDLKRIVFANRGPLRDLGLRDGNLVLDLPDLVPGRFGRNKTPILAAPMLVCGLDVQEYWEHVESALTHFSLSDTTSLPMRLAAHLRSAQMDGRRTVYLGTNDPCTRRLGQEWEQFWNEGVNKDGNLLLMDGFRGLPRDSHMTVEGLLGNADSVQAVFLHNPWLELPTHHPLYQEPMRVIDDGHSGLTLAEAELTLDRANHDEFASQMPTIVVTLKGKPSLRHSAVLGQLFADTTYVYSRLANVEPGTNPQVREVRDRAAAGLAKRAQQLRSNP